MPDRRFLKRLVYFVAIAAGVFFVAGLLQTSFFPAFLGIVPDLILVLTAGVAFYLGALDGAVMGLLGGVIIEGLGGAGLSPAPLFYLAVGVGFGLLSARFFRGKWLHVAIYSALYCSAKAIYSLVRILVSSGEPRLWEALAFSVLPEFFATLAMALMLAIPVQLLSGVLRGRRSQKKGKGGLGDT